MNTPRFDKVVAEAQKPETDLEFVQRMKNSSLFLMPTNDARRLLRLAKDAESLAAAAYDLLQECRAMLDGLEAQPLIYRIDKAMGEKK
jgi:hypothetical protein